MRALDIFVHLHAKFGYVHFYPLVSISVYSNLVLVRINFYLFLTMYFFIPYFFIIPVRT